MSFLLFVAAGEFAMGVAQLICHRPIWIAILCFFAACACCFSAGFKNGVGA